MDERLKNAFWGALGLCLTVLLIAIPVLAAMLLIAFALKHWFWTMVFACVFVTLVLVLWMKGEDDE